MNLKPLKLTVLTDTHYYSDKSGTSGKAYEKASAKSQKLLAESGVVLQSAFKQIVDENKGDIESIAAVYHAWLKGDGYEDVKGFCKSATIEEIREADYSLVPGRYVGIDDSGKMSDEEVKAEIIRVKNELNNNITYDFIY